MAEHMIQMTLQGNYLARNAFLEAEADLSRMLRTTAGVMGTVNSFINTLQGLESSTMSVRLAQERYNDSIMKYGPFSKEAERATTGLDRSARMYTRSQRYMAFSVVSTTANLLMQGSAIRAMLGAKSADIAVTATQTAGIWAQVAALKAKAVAMAVAMPWLVPAMIAGGALLLGGALAGGAMRPTSMTLSPSITIRADANFDRAVDDLGMTIKSEYRRYVGN